MCEPMLHDSKLSQVDLSIWGVNFILRKYLRNIEVKSSKSLVKI